MIPYVVSVALVALMPAATAAATSAPTSAPEILKNYLQAPAIASYNAGSSGFTVECWAQVWKGGGDADPGIIRCRGPVDGGCGNTSVEVWELWMSTNLSSLGTVYWSIVDSGVCRELQSTSGIYDDAYHHVAGTYDGATMRIYIDGVLSNSLSVSGLNVQVAGGEVRVGNSSYAKGLHGQIDEVRIWSVARTQSQIAADMTTEIAPGAGLVAYWQLNGNGTDLVDANTLVPIGTVPFDEGRLNQAAYIINPFILPPYPDCSDGVDNDGDGCADFPFDLGCSSPVDYSEEAGGCASPPGVPLMGFPASLVLVGPLMVLAVIFLRKKMAARSS
jgi:hypothetical protein